MSCPDCYRGALLTEQPKGVTSDIAGAYFAAAAGQNPSTTTAIVILTDIYGLSIPNPKVLADFFAENLGCDVWVPNVFVGGPPVSPDVMVMPERAGEKRSIWTWIKIIFTQMIPAIPALIRERPSVADAQIADFMAKLKAHKSYEKIGAVGYCFGGAAAIRFAATVTFNSVVIAHPGATNLAQFKAMKVPCSWVCAEEDMIFSKALRLQAEAEFSGRTGKDNFVDYEFKEYTGTVHGFASRPNLEYPEVKEGFEGALRQTVEWFRKTLFA
ncbi:dienelactone hydrolase endo-1,3,1,4-beta-D-glucanase [Hymenopellis radicata]|nr:dienelactone hydrolase endo-1,3,1,4-beta-D-glucanase [Hymenopellis radicata]